MKIALSLIALIISPAIYGQNWTAIKNSISPVIELPTEYDSVYVQPLATVGWEDGVHISNDGLHLYCTYVPIDFLSFVLNESLPNDFSNDYLRGAPTFGMDLTSNPIGAPEWLHADILYAHRNSVNDPFTTWTLSNMARPFYSEGAPTPTFIDNSNSVEYMLFTSNDNTSNDTDIWFIHNTNANPTGVGAPAPSPINTQSTEDNPHLVRIDHNRLVLFFDSDNLPNGKGDIDIWFTESTDNGVTWSVPSNVSSINTASKEHQPFLHYDLDFNNWFLYYAAMHTDGKLAVFRVQQNTTNDWNSWGSPELVISAGNAAGIGEPTLTTNGDISFVVVYEDPSMNSTYDHFDSDPWFLRKANTITSLSTKEVTTPTSISPNPAHDVIRVNTEEAIETIMIHDSMGKLRLVTTEKTMDIKDLCDGLYFLSIQLKNGKIFTEKLIKK